MPACRQLSARCFAAGLLVSLLAASPALAWPPILQDPDLPPASSEAFPLDPALEPAVRFWAQLFVKHDSGQVVLHDRQNLDIVWQVLELPRDDKGEVDRLATDKLVRRATEELKARLRRLEIEPAPQDDEDRVILSLAGGQDPSRLVGAWTRVRTQRGVADKFQEGLTRAKPFFAEMQQILVAEGVPPEVAALPFVESMFNTTARSYVGAAGVWQLMPATARGLGLKVARGGDERLDVLKATRAAAKMLRKNYRMLGTWPLAITAYNHGPNGLHRAVEQVGSTDLVYLIDNYEKSTWGFASKNFYVEFLAATTVLAQQDETFAALIKPPLPSVETAAAGEPGPAPASAQSATPAAVENTQIQ
jgi:membrane-bound lytic murein transglycosylase D